MNWMRTSPRLRASALGLTTLALVAGCGASRVDHDRVVAAGNGGGQSGSVTAPGTTTDVADNVPEADGAVPGRPTPGAAAAAGSTTPGAAAPGTSRGSAGSGAAATTSSGPAPHDRQGQARVHAGRGFRRSARSLHEGVVADQAGPGHHDLRFGWELARRPAGRSPGLGLSCELTRRRAVPPGGRDLVDDGSDSSRVSSNWNQLMKVKGAVACIACGSPIPMPALRAAAERDKIAVVGGDLTAGEWFRSPYLFPQGGGAFSSYDGSSIEGARAAKTGALGLLYCVEASVCTEIKNNFATSVARSGLTAGPVKAISITQPDYTAECKTMKDAGVTVLFMAADGAGISRMARSCASISYRPVLASGSVGTPGNAGSDPSLRRNGLYLGTPIAPYLASDIPGVVAWQNAMKKFAPRQALEQTMLLAWAAGKLFEAALAKVADEARAGDVTKDLVLEGLWRVKKEKLNGISPGVSFNQRSLRPTWTAITP